jgi:hypothetical protein
MEMGLTVSVDPMSEGHSRTPRCNIFIVTTESSISNDHRPLVEIVNRMRNGLLVGRNNRRCVFWVKGNQY